MHARRIAVFFQLRKCYINVIFFNLQLHILEMMIDVSTYEGADFMGDRLRHGVQLSLVPRA